MTSLVKVSDDIRLNLESSQPMIFVSLDFSKVFDSVCHEMFIFKLRQRYGFSYLFQFIFFLCIKGSVVVRFFLCHSVFLLFIDDKTNDLEFS
jgi:hypothetical protein